MNNNAYVWLNSLLKMELKQLHKINWIKPHSTTHAEMAKLISQRFLSDLVVMSTITILTPKHQYSMQQEKAI